MTAWREDRIGSAHRGENPMVMCEDVANDHLTDLDRDRRAAFLLDLSLLGEAVLAACRPRGAHRVNYEVLGNSLPWLHGHVHPRYAWEPTERAGWPGWCYPDAERSAPEHAYDDAEHGALRAAITDELERVMRSAYGG